MKKISLSRMSDRQILKLRICDLKLHVSQSAAGNLVDRFFKELNKKGFEYFRPKVYVGDEWFSPEGVNAISIPFYLLHPRLLRLEKKMMKKVEGETRREFLKLLRHEAGHCLDHSYKFSKTKNWQNIFGSPRLTYNPDSYKAEPTSKDFVRHLEDHYAQAHPDEDFAETFATWMTPNFNWQKKYGLWPKALKKINYVEKIVKKVKKQKPLADFGPLLGQASRKTMTLEEFYRRRQKVKKSQK